MLCFASDKDLATHLNNDVVLLERLVVEEAVQDVLGSSSIPHLQSASIGYI